MKRGKLQRRWVRNLYLGRVKYKPLAEAISSLFYNTSTSEMMKLSIVCSGVPKLESGLLYIGFEVRDLGGKRQGVDFNGE
jgi:hypothetical protein